MNDDQATAHEPNQLGRQLRPAHHVDKCRRRADGGDRWHRGAVCHQLIIPASHQTAELRPALAFHHLSIRPTSVHLSPNTGAKPITDSRRLTLFGALAINRTLAFKRYSLAC